MTEQLESSPETMGQEGADVAKLQEAFAAFNEVTGKLSQQYQALEERVRELNVELEDKNRQLEHNLQEKERIQNYLQNILASVEAGVLVVDHEGVITSFNRGAEEITGQPASEIRGKRFQDVFAPHLLPRLKFPAHQIGEVWNGESQYCRDERGECPLSLTLSPFRNSREEKEGAVMVFQDISRIKELEDQAQRSGRLTAMGEMCISIAHEVRNPLGAIELFSTMLCKDLEEDAQRRDIAENISTAVRSLNNIISNLLLFTRAPKPVARSVSLHTQLDSALRFADHLMRAQNVVIEKDYRADAMTLEADPDLLQQVFLNVIFNGIQAMSEGGVLRICTVHRSFPERVVEIQFCDSGNGIPRESLQKIFHPFYTTKERGTGLGLSIVHNIVSAHNGSILIDSEVGKGTTFSLILPADQSQDGEREEQMDDMTATAGPETRDQRAETRD